MKKVEIIFQLDKEDKKPSSDNNESNPPGVGEYNGDELDDLDKKPLPKEDNYTIIDGIIYQGEYLIINKGNIIPLGNNPENAKTGVSLEFLIYKDEDVIFKSPKLKAGTGVNFVPSNYLEEGLYTLHMIVNVYHENGTQDAGYEQELKIKVTT